MQRQLVILDRDGVINRDSSDFVKSADEWLPLPGSPEAIGQLCRAGATVCVISNQSGLGRGLFDESALDAMHAKMQALVREHGGNIERVIYCPHRPDAGCDCRKPLPGMLQRLSRELDQPLAGVPCVGDSLRDLQAARAAGAMPVLVLTGNGRETRRALDAAGDDVDTYADLKAFADAYALRVSEG